MARRLLVQALAVGPVPIPEPQAHHARDVLRLKEGDTVELFSANGQTAEARLIRVNAREVIAAVERIHTHAVQFNLTLASATPKGNRADWMVEKLAELGVGCWIPLQTDRSIVHPDGISKIQRWERIAAEAAKQCKSPGVMKIGPLTPLKRLLESPPGPVGVLSTQGEGAGLLDWPRNEGRGVLLIGPEGGWSDSELNQFASLHLTLFTLGATILRIETAAVAAGAVIAARFAST